MEWDRIENDWLHYKSSFMRRWPRLSNIDVMTCRRVWLLRNIREKYGISHNEAELQLADWQRSQTDIERAA